MSLTHLHFDCFCGISGDMTLGALVDLGVDPAAIEQALKGLPIGPFALRAEPLKRQGIVGTRVHVEVQEEHAHRHLRHVIEYLDQAGLPPRVRARAADAYTRLADAEARVHGSTREKIHFHEVGAKDAIVDVAGAMVGFELLGVTSFSASPVVVGSGTVECQHGTMPVPAPATAELLRGMPHHAGPWAKEMATPTGVAILATVLAEGGLEGGSDPRGFPTGAQSALRVEKIGYGGGARELPGCPNMLRLMLCHAPQSAGATTGLEGLRPHTVLVLECEIDDMSPEIAGHAMERLLAAGAYDVQFSPVQMKKNRPALRVRVLGAPKDERALAGLLLRETSTFGVRREVRERWCLDRRQETVETPFGPIAVKLGLIGEEILKGAPEYEACRAAAQSAGRPLIEVLRAAQAAIDARWGAGAHGGPATDPFAQ